MKKNEPQFFDNTLFLNDLLGAFKKCLRYNEHNIPVWTEKMLVYLSLNVDCSLKLTVFLSSCPALSSNLEIGQIAARIARIMPFFDFYIDSSKEIIFFLQIHSLNLHKEENLTFDICNCKWFKCNKQNIPFWPNSVFSKWEGGGGNVDFEHSLYEKKSELIIFPNDFLR